MKTQDLFLAFESELADLLRPANASSRRDSLGVGRLRGSVRRQSSSGSNLSLAGSSYGSGSPSGEAEYEADGTLLCSRINYDVLVTTVQNCVTDRNGSVYCSVTSPAGQVWRTC